MLEISRRRAVDYDLTVSDDSIEFVAAEARQAKLPLASLCFGEDRLKIIFNSPESSADVTIVETGDDVITGDTIVTPGKSAIAIANMRGAWYVIGANLASVGSAEPSYLVYTALLSQIGMAAPTPTVLENTIGAVALEYQTPGNYSAILAGAFPAGKTVAILGAQGTVLFDYSEAPDKVNIRTKDYSDVEADELIAFSLFEIRVYP